MKTYLIWKRDSNAEGRQSSIHLRQVEQDGITFEDEWKDVTLVTANYTTERRVIEGPWMIYRYFYYKLFYILVNRNYCDIIVGLTLLVQETILLFVLRRRWIGY